jgi:hypothetical protein
MTKNKCINCGSEKVARERRPNGNDYCKDCDVIYPSSCKSKSEMRRLSFQKESSMCLPDDAVSKTNSVDLLNVTAIEGARCGYNTAIDEVLELIRKYEEPINIKFWSGAKEDLVKTVTNIIYVKIAKLKELVK